MLTWQKKIVWRPPRWLNVSLRALDSPPILCRRLATSVLQQALLIVRQLLQCRLHACRQSCIDGKQHASPFEQTLYWLLFVRAMGDTSIGLFRVELELLVVFFVSCEFAEAPVVCLWATDWADAASVIEWRCWVRRWMRVHIEQKRN